MKKATKSIFIMSIVMLMLIACSTESSHVTEGKTDKPNQVESNMDIIPEDESNLEIIPHNELAILKNEPELYEGRPLANVPVEVISVERFSDRVVIEASLGEIGSGHYFTLVQLDSSETDINQRDALYIDGVVRNEIDTKKIDLPPLLKWN